MEMLVYAGGVEAESRAFSGTELDGAELDFAALDQGACLACDACDFACVDERVAPGQTLNSYGDLFAYEHDPQYIGDDRYWLFDDESAEATSTGGFPANGLPYSRAVEVQINPAAKTATMIASRDQPEGLTAYATGGVQPLANDDPVVGWGTLPYVSIYNQAGALIYNAEYNGGLSSYRAYVFNWPPAAGRGGWTGQRDRGRWPGQRRR